MKQIPKNNRNRQRSGRRQGGGGNNGHNLNRVYESAGPEGKVRGTAQQIIEKYSTLARDATTSGDRIAAENFFQHAEHYQRIVATALAAEAEAQERRREQQAQQQAQQQQQQPNGHAQQNGSAANGNGSPRNGPDRHENAAPASEASAKPETKETPPAQPSSDGSTAAPKTESRQDPLAGDPRPTENAPDASAEETQKSGLERTISRSRARKSTEESEGADEAPAPKRRGRPRKAVAAEEKDATPDAG